MFFVCSLERTMKDRKPVHTNMEIACLPLPAMWATWRSFALWGHWCLRVCKCRYVVDFAPFVPAMRAPRCLFEGAQDCSVKPFASLCPPVLAMWGPWCPFEGVHKCSVGAVCVLALAMWLPCLPLERDSWSKYMLLNICSTSIRMQF